MESTKSSVFCLDICQKKDDYAGSPAFFSLRAGERSCCTDITHNMCMPHLSKSQPVVGAVREPPAPDRWPFSYRTAKSYRIRKSYAVAKKRRVRGTSSDIVVVLKHLCSLRQIRGQGSRAKAVGRGVKPHKTEPDASLLSLFKVNKHLIRIRSGVRLVWIKMGVTGEIFLCITCAKDGLRRSSRRFF